MRFAVREILAPTLARTGSLLSGYLVGSGVGSSDAEKIAVGAVTLVLVGIDLALGHYARKKL